MPRVRRFPEAPDPAQLEVLGHGVGQEAERLAQRALDVEGELVPRDRAQIVIHAASVAQEQDGNKSAPCSELEDFQDGARQSHGGNYLDCCSACVLDADRRNRSKTPGR